MKKRQNKNNNYKIFVQRLIVIFSVILIIIILAWLIMIYIEKKEGISKKEGELGEIGFFSTDLMTGIVSPVDCNDSSLKNVWDSVFQESSDDIIINKSQAINVNGCSNYLLYKIKNNQELFLLYDYSFNFIINVRMLMGLYLNASPDLVNNLTNINSSNIINNLTSDSFYNLINDRYIDSLENATSEFSSKFKISSSSWQYNSSSKTYYFNDTLIGDNLTRIKFGILFENKSLDYFAYITTSSIFQFMNINNLTMLKNSNWSSAISLDNFFSNNLKLNYFIYNLSGSNINYSLENNTLKFKPNANFIGSESFKVMAYNGSNYLYSNVFQVSVFDNNIPPEFIQGNCNLTQVNWYMNENYSLDVSDCFNDSDGNNLSYRFGLYDDSPLTIIQNGSLLKLIPQANWFGNDSFYVYANDSINETMGIVYFNIRYSGITINQTVTPIVSNETFGIKDPTPNGEIITDFFGKNQTFFISNTIYDSLEWYLDGQIIQSNSNTFEVKGLSIGNHTVEVRIRKDDLVDSKIWKVIIEGEEKTREFVFDAGWLMFYLILIVVAIIIILVIWLFIGESRNKNKRMGLDLGTVDKNFNDLSRKEDMSRRFNIPR